jgi:hypothetical protein
LLNISAQTIISQALVLIIGSLRVLMSPYEGGCIKLGKLKKGPNGQ